MSNEPGQNSHNVPPITIGSMVEASSFSSKGEMDTQKEIRIVLLEDEDVDAELVRLELQRASLTTTIQQVKTKNEFLQTLVQFSPDIILADYTLPHFSALEALKILREKMNDVPVILVTGSQSEDVAVECMKQGASDYILKQSLTRLPSSIVNVLKQREAERENKLTQEKLQHSENRFRRLFTNNPLPLFVFYQDSLRLIEINNAAVAQYGYTREEILQKWVTDLWPLEDIPRAFNEIRQLSARAHVSGFWKHRWKNGELRDVHAEMQTITVGGRSAVLLVANDVTEQQRAERELRISQEQLRALSGHLESIREEERSRIAREIHDELGQLLTALSMDASWIRGRLARISDPQAITVRQQAESMIKLIDTSIQSVRKIAAELRPRALDDLGLIPAIEWQVQDFQTRANLQCSFTSNVEEINIEPERATAVFRILQESLTNIARHANASQVTIDLHVERDLLALRVQDNGKGISEHALTARESLGLLGMKERALLLGGVLKITGMPSKGTSVTLEMPLRVHGHDEVHGQ